MRSLFIIICISLSISLTAQNTKKDNIDSTEKQQDTIVRPPLLDSALVGKSIFTILKNSNNNGKVTIKQSYNLTNVYNSYIQNNKTKKLNGYRVRIFFDSKQTARETSELIEKKFIESFPLIPTYRSYTNPFFKVVVGNYRTKADATKALKHILEEFPQAVIVKDTISYPDI